MSGTGEHYATSRRRIIDCLAGVTDGEAARPVAACPGWSVHDVVAHLAGACSDILAGNLTGVATDRWTAAQVEARRGHTLAALIDEWCDAAARVESFADGFPGRTGQQWVTDLTTHEHDIRAAVGRPGARDSAEVLLGLDFLVTLGFHSSVSARGLPPIEVRTPQRSWVAGTGDPRERGGEGSPTRQEPLAAVLSGDEPPPAGTPAGRVDAPAYELFRALTGRRSPAQIRALRWTVDPEPYLPAFQFGPFTTRGADLDE